MPNCFKNCPEIKICCGCIPNLRTASAIIAVLALVTNPIVSWLMVRHTYAMRVSCYLTAMSRADIVDLNINNIISFGFGINSDLGASCLSPGDSNNSTEENSTEGSKTNDVVMGLGWVVLVADIVFLVTSMVFLVRIYRNPTRRLVTAFIISAMVAVILSTFYGVLYVIVCAIRGNGVALCELILSFFDVTLRTYCLLVVRTYANELPIGSRLDRRVVRSVIKVAQAILSPRPQASANSTQDSHNTSTFAYSRAFDCFMQHWATAANGS